MRHIPISKQYFAAIVQSIIPQMPVASMNRHRVPLAQSQRAPIAVQPALLSNALQL
jgi:hypothetical protein